MRLRLRWRRQSNRRKAPAICIPMAVARVDPFNGSCHTERAKIMTTVNAHFDGKVIIPDEPLDLPPNQPLIVSIEPVTEKQGAAEESVLTWLAANAVESHVLPTDLADRHDHYLYGRSTKDEKE